MADPLKAFDDAVAAAGKPPSHDAGLVAFDTVIGDMARARLKARGTTPEEIKRRAAAGESISPEDPSLRERFGADLAAVTGGAEALAGGVVGGTVEAAVNIARAPFAPTARAVGTILGGGTVRDAYEAGKSVRPWRGISGGVAESAESAERYARRSFGVREGTIVPQAEIMREVPGLIATVQGIKATAGQLRLQNIRRARGITESEPTATEQPSSPAAKSEVPILTDSQIDALANETRLGNLKQSRSVPAKMRAALEAGEIRESTPAAIREYLTQNPDVAREVAAQYEMPAEAHPPASAPESVSPTADRRAELLRHDEAVRAAEAEHLDAVRRADERFKTIEVTPSGKRPRGSVAVTGENVEYMTSKQAAELRDQMIGQTRNSLAEARAARERFYESLTEDAPTPAQLAEKATPEPPAAPVEAMAPPPPQEPPGGTTAPAGATPPPSAPDAETSGRAVDDSLYTRIREFVDDDWYRVRKLVEDPESTVSSTGDPYQSEILFHGRLASRIEDAHEAVQIIDRDMVRSAKEAGIPDAELLADVNEYLHARHAPERNAAIGEGAAGMTDSEAADALTRIDSRPHAEAVRRFAERLQEMNNQTLDVLRDGGVISDELHATLRERYQRHVPLNRIMGETQDVGSVLTARPLDVRSTGIRRAVGSERAVADITTNIVTNLEQAFVRAEKNRVDLATLEFARNNPDLRYGELPLFQEIRPRARGTAFDGETIIIDRVEDPQVLSMYENGKPTYLRINDPNLATALRGINRFKVDGVLRYVQAYTRFMSSMATRFNPEFAIPNKIRDLQEAVIYAASKREIGVRAAARIALDAGSMKSVMDGIRGIDSEGARLYNQMRLDGGTTGGMGLSTRQQVALDIEQIRRVNRSAPRAAAQRLLGSIDALNQIFEDSTRLSVYRQALERGLSRPEAARLAKEASINFNKFGRGGPQLNALYMFANASIQGSVKMLRAMRDPKVAATVVTGITAAVAATNEWNKRIDPDWRKHVAKYDRLSSLVVMLPPSEDGSVNYMKVPVAWGVKPIKVAADYMTDAMDSTDVTPGQAVAGITAATIEGYNPIGGTDLTSALTPTALDLPVDLARNRAWHGGQIRPEKRDEPRSALYFMSLANTPQGRAAIKGSEVLEDRGIEVSPADIKYVYDTLIGGAGRAASRVLLPSADVNEAPIINRFYEHVDQERLGAMQSSEDRERMREETIRSKADERRKSRH